MNKEDQLLKLSTTLYNQLNIIWARAIEGKGACYISSMERGDIEELLKEYNETKFPSLPSPPSSPTGEPKANAVFNKREAEDKENIAELKEILSSSPTATAEDDFARHFGKFRFGLYKASFDHYLETGKISGSLLLSVREYTSLKEQEARRQAIQEVKDHFTFDLPIESVLHEHVGKILNELEKIK